MIENPELLTTVMGAREAIEDTEDEQVLRKYNEIFDLQSKSCVQASPSVLKAEALDIFLTIMQP